MGVSESRRVLEYVRSCVDGGRLPTDVERAFLLEDLKAAGVETARLRHVRQELTERNDACGRRLRDAAELRGAAETTKSAFARGVANAGEYAEGCMFASKGVAEARTFAVDVEGATSIGSGRACENDGADAAAKGLRGPSALVKWRTPEEELEGVARYVQEAVRVGGDGLPASRVCVAVPDNRWARLAQRALEHRRFAAIRTQLGYAPREDPRDAGLSPVSGVFCRLALLADPSDALAWRAWLGLGRPDLGVSLWAKVLEAWDASSPFDAPASLERAALDCVDIKDALADARGFLLAKSGLRGYSLAHAVGMGEVPQLVGVMDGVDVCDDACTLFGKVQACLCGPSFGDDPHVVHVVTYDAAAPAGYGVVVAMAAVEGLAGRFSGASADDARNARDGLQRVLDMPCDTLIVSYFSRMPIELARKLGLPVSRTRREGAHEMACVCRAHVLDELGGSLPPAQDGEAFLAG